MAALLLRRTRQHHGRHCGHLARVTSLNHSGSTPNTSLLQKQRRRRCLVLRGRSHPTLYREMGEKRLDLGHPHVARMPLAVVQDETPNPLNILRFRADAVMLGANPLAHLAQQFGQLRRRCGAGRICPPFLRPACAETTSYRAAERVRHLFGRSIYACSGVYFTLGVFG